MLGRYVRTHLSDQTLLRDLAERLARERGNTAELLADLAEVDARRLYAPAGYSTMRDYCIRELHLSQDAAYKRIQAARTAREFPAIFEAVADGGLHLTAVCLLAPYLTPDNAAELLGVAVHRSKAEIQRLLADRFPQSELLGLVETLPAALPIQPEQLAPGPEGISERSAAGAGALAGPLAPAQVQTLVERSRLKPLAPQRFALQVSIGQSTHDKLRHVQALLSHQIPSGDLAKVLDFALDAAVQLLEKRKFAATTQPRPSQRRSTAGERYVPAAVKRAVWKRDGGQCTFVSQDGQRCQARKFLEFDHATPMARGGEATVGSIRLRCRAHNQYTAECAFGTEFMRRKREEAQRAAEERAAAAWTRARADAAVEEIKQDVICALRNLGYRADEACRAVDWCDGPDASFEQRVRGALFFLQKPCHRHAARIPATAT
jgi:hypothetical protein